MSTRLREEPVLQTPGLPGGEIREIVDAARRARQADSNLAEQLGQLPPSAAGPSTQYLFDLSTAPALPAASEHKLIVAAQAGDQRARARLVEAYLPQVAATARIYRHTPRLERLELIQEGVAGLLRALERFDLTRGVPCWSFARWWVRQAMQRLVTELSRPMILSDQALQDLAHVRDANERFLAGHGRFPTTAELAEFSELPFEQVQSLLAIDKAPRSVHESLTDADGESVPLAEVLPDPQADQQYERVLDALEAPELLALLSALTERERDILRARYGLAGEEQTLGQAGERLGLSAERVRQLERRALMKLRAAARDVAET